MWLLINVKNVHKHFLESEETQQGHMRSQRQGVRSTTVLEQAENIEPVPKQQTIMINVQDATETMYTDQTGKFPHISSRGKQYQMIA